MTASFNSTTARAAGKAAHDAALQATFADITLGIDDILADPNHNRAEKLAILTELGHALTNRGQLPASLGQAQPTVAPAGIGAAPAAPTSSSTTSNAADVQRIAELESALKDAATAAGVTTFPLTSGKIDAKRLVADIAASVKAQVAAAATPAPAAAAPAAAPRRAPAFGRKPK